MKTKFIRGTHCFIGENGSISLKEDRELDVGDVFENYFETIYKVIEIIDGFALRVEEVE